MRAVRAEKRGELQLKLAIRFGCRGGGRGGEGPRAVEEKAAA